MFKNKNIINFIRWLIKYFIKNIILYSSTYLRLYLIYFFNVLYYHIYYNHTYKALRQFKKKGVKEIYYSYVLGTWTMDLLRYLHMSRFFLIMFFYFYYFWYFWKIIKMQKFKYFVKLFKYFVNYIIYFFNFNYGLLMRVHILKDELYQKKARCIYDYYRNYGVYNNFFFFYIFYMYLFIKLIRFILFWMKLWIRTYYIRFIIKIQHKKNSLSKYHLILYKNKLKVKIKNIIWKIIIDYLDKFFQEYNIKNIKMTIKYYYSKIKRYLINLFNIISLNIKIFINLIKEAYFKYFVNFIFFQILKNRGNLINYYIFIFLKYLKSFFFWLWDYNIFNTLLKKLKKKW